MFLIFKPIDIVVTDEPAMYCYKSKNGKLKIRYDLTECHFVSKKKAVFKLVKNGENQYRHISNKFKVGCDKSKKSSQKYSLLELLKDLTIQ